MTTHTTRNGSTITVDGTHITITSVRGVTTGTIRPGEYLEPIPASATVLIAAAKKAGIDKLYGWWEGKTMAEEIAMILNAAIKAITPEPTAAEIAKDAIESKRRKMANEVNSGLTGPDPEAAADCYDIDMRHIDAWYHRQIAAWEAQYPVETAARALSERIYTLNVQIGALEDMAKGALLYDADGWITPDEQQRRHDGHMAEAAKLRAQLAMEAR